MKKERDIPTSRLMSSARLAMTLFSILFVVMLGSNPASSAPQHEIDFYSQEAQELSGEKISFEQLRGKVVLLNFWASWCKPCFREFPEIEKLHQKYKARGLVVIGLSITPGRGGMEAFLKKTGATFPIWIDQDEKVSDLYQVSDMPTTLLVDGNGNVVHREVGFSREGIENLSQVVERLLP